MREEGYAFSDLGGDRQRYGHFGWENAGREWRFDISKRSLQEKDDPVGFEVALYKASPEEVDAVIAVHDREPLRVKRTRELYELLLSRKERQVWLAKDREGITAYAVSHPSHPDKNSQQIAEFGGSAEGMHAILIYLTAVIGGEVHIHSPWSHPLNTLFFSIGSEWSLEPTHMLKIFDLKATLCGFADQLCAKYRELGFQGKRAVALEVDGTDQRVEIGFSPEAMIVRESPQFSRLLTLSERDMVRFIFGPSPPSAAVNLPADVRFLEAILPVDFYIWHNDNV